jgi:hypothetical protein
MDLTIKPWVGLWDYLDGTSGASGSGRRPT